MEKLLSKKRNRSKTGRMSFFRYIGFKNNHKTTVRKVFPNCITDYSVTRRIIPNKLLSSRACFRFILQRKCKFILGLKKDVDFMMNQFILGLNLWCKLRLGFR